MLYNVREYHRPTTLDDAVRLLQRTDVKTVPLAGGTTLVGEGTPEIEAMVDLADLGLGTITREGNTLRLGAMVRLQTIVDELGDVAGGALAESARRMAGWNIRNAATIGGALGSGDVHAPLSVMLAALDAQITSYDGNNEEIISWAELSSAIQERPLRGKLITSLALPAASELVAAYEQVARTPADRPIVCAAASLHPAGDGNVRVGLAIGGLLKDLLILHETVSEDQVAAAPDRLWMQMGSNPQVQSNFLGSAEYRESVAPILAHRAVSSALAAAR